MKIYRSVTIDIRTGETLHEDSYEYSGAITECKSNTNQTFKDQANNAYNQVSQQSTQILNVANSLNSMMVQRFGQQSATYNSLNKQLNSVFNMGAPDFRNYQPIGGAGSGAGGGGGGGRGGGGASTYERASLRNYGWDPAHIGDVIEQPEWDKLQTMMSTEATEETTRDFENAQKAFGERALQLGGFAPGLMSAGLADIYGQAASQEATGQRDVVKFIEGGKIDYSKLVNQLREDMYTKAQALRESDIENQRNNRTAAGAAAAGRALQAAMFNAQMAFNYKTAQSDQFLKALGIGTNLAGLQQGDWQGAMQGQNQLNLGTLNNWQGMYQIGSNGVINTKGGGIGGFLGGLARAALPIGLSFIPGVGPALAAATGGMSFGGGSTGGSNAFSWPTASSAYSGFNQTSNPMDMIGGGFH